MEIEAEGRYGQGRNPENIYVRRSKMNSTNRVSSFALGSILSCTAQYAILRALKGQLWRSRLPFSTKPHQLWPDSRWMGALGRPPGRPQMKYSPPATVHGTDTDTSTIQYSALQDSSISRVVKSHTTPPIHLITSISISFGALHLFLPPSQFCTQMRRIKY
jgi:hypothetical protein